ncbi:hypothetical protein FO519_003559 [Halicephalobus sp. NKZ332]|nr:hypothetical protein FO519_003559 [Halicephalobus sp. NKZ332]
MRVFIVFVCVVLVGVAAIDILPTTTTSFPDVTNETLLLNETLHIPVSFDDTINMFSKLWTNMKVDPFSRTLVAIYLNITILIGIYALMISIIVHQSLKSRRYVKKRAGMFYTSRFNWHVMDNEC